jgi:asparagine synthase (glutamine-hydrolysing)
MGTMCGIAGFLTNSAANSNELGDISAGMSAALQHRGPDDEGIWIDGDSGIALVHRRLAIVDLSAAAHQPMTSADGRFLIIYNGEVYNFQAMRSELEAKGRVFRGHSDTEVILESIADCGIKATVSRLIGMFALAVWDRRDRTLTLVRDRLGIKPIYWTKSGNLFLFGSELKALHVHPRFKPQIDRSAVAAFLRHNYIPAPRTIYEGVYKLEPGCILTLPCNGEPNIERFWDARAVANAGQANQFDKSDAELTDDLEALLQDAVSRRMIADVPLGAFLSGGIDSSTVVALMQSANMDKVRTFSISFEEAGFDEAPHAAAVARHLGTEHTELTVTARQALDVIPKLSEWYDEPFADSSQIPTYLVSAMTRQHVTVALSGDGGDELFAGYNRYQFAQDSWGKLSLLPRPVRQGMACAITAIPPSTWDKIATVVPGALRPQQVGDKAHKLASLLGLEDDTALYRQLVTHWEPSQLMPGVAEAKGVLWDPTVADDFPRLLERMQFLDTVTYLPDDILTKVDRASMAVALEARVPLIDHRVVEFAWRLPQRVKVRNGTTKWLLRQVLDRHVPAALIDRPKMGFGIPLGDWLRGPLRDWAEELLSEQRLREDGLVDGKVVRRYWQEHLSGKRNWQYLLWDVLMLESWRARWG